jgi:hypothetical protein
MAETETRQAGVTSPALLQPGAASEHLKDRGVNRTVATLAKLRCLGGGPPWHRVGRNVVYSTDDLDAWAAGIISPTTFTITAQYVTRAA